MSPCIRTASYHGWHYAEKVQSTQTFVFWIDSGPFKLTNRRKGTFLPMCEQLFQTAKKSSIWLWLRWWHHRRAGPSLYEDMVRGHLCAEEKPCGWVTGQWNMNCMCSEYRWGGQMFARMTHMTGGGGGRGWSLNYICGATLSFLTQFLHMTNTDWMCESLYSIKWPIMFFCIPVKVIS